MKSTKHAAMALAISVLTIVGATSWVANTTEFTAITDSEVLQNVRSKFLSLVNHAPEDRVYLQFDKTMYEPGETIWYNAYVRDGATMQASAKSDILYVELINPAGGVEKKISLVALHGSAPGDFTIDANANGGMYKIKAYTQWQLNNSDTGAFVKDIMVQDVILPNLKMKLDFERKAYGEGDVATAKLELATNENKPLSNYAIKYIVTIDGKPMINKSSETGNDGTMYLRFELPKKITTTDALLNVMIDYNGRTESISRAVPIVLNNISLQFFPEGGDLVAGTNCYAAFRAVNEQGKPADVEGEVRNSKGEVVSTFASYYNGMGTMSITPDQNETYTAYVTKPANITQQFTLSPALASGYTMHVENNYDKQLIMRVNAPADGDINIVGTIRGNMAYANNVYCKAGNNTILLSTQSMPTGVLQLTLFNGAGMPMCERLTFVNYHNRLKINIATNKDKYQPREQVKMTVTVRDENDKPVAANLSLSVTNDQMLAMADDKQGNIISDLLLQPDVHNKIDEPAFYFSQHPKARQALDQLLLTSGWRRFAWHQVLNGPLPALAYSGERAVITGNIVNGADGTPLKNVTIKFGNKNFQSNGEGAFNIKGVDITKNKEATFMMQGFTTLNHNVEYYGQHHITMYPVGYKPVQIREVVVMDMMVEDAPMMQQAAAVNEVVIVQEQRLPKKRALRQKNVAPVPVAMKDDAVMAKADKPIIEEKQMVKNVNKNNVVANRGFLFDAKLRDKEMEREQARTPYYCAREFAAPDYSKATATSAPRTDFRTTIFWKGNLEIDNTGTTTLTFYTGDEITSYRATIEGVGNNGLVGVGEKNIYTQLPFSVKAMLPLQLVSEDAVSIPVMLANNTGAPLTVAVYVQAPDVMTAYTALPQKVVVPPHKTEVVYYNYKIGYAQGDYEIKINATANGMNDAITQALKIIPKGFPVSQSFSGSYMHGKHNVEIKDAVTGSINVELTAFPNVVSDLLTGIEGILRQPGGCFEQTSMSSYPNVLVMDYLKTTDNEDPKIMARAEKLLDEGYKMLVKFETPQRGYEWFGSNPGHEALTAYGLMQFNDMKAVYSQVDNKMIERTATWLNSRKDGKGGYLRDSKALDSYGRASTPITNAYITYALAAAQTKGLEKEVEYTYRQAMESDDPYIIALAANTLFDHNRDRRAEKLVTSLLSMQDKDGSWTGKAHSITYSTGKALSVETTALALMALLKSENINATQVKKGAEYLVATRNGGGDFGNTQSTIMALKALTAYAKYATKTDEAGNIELYVDGELVSTQKFEAGRKEAIIFHDISKYVGQGKHLLEVKYQGCKNPLPYSLAVNYNTVVPQSSNECKVKIVSKLADHTAKVGETVRCNVQVTNETKDGLPSTMVILSTPAGCTFQPWQLKDMMAKKLFDYYEVKANTLYLYYRQMMPAQSIVLNFDLKAEIPGTYEAPASSSYLYYTNEYKSWDALGKLIVTK